MMVIYILNKKSSGLLTRAFQWCGAGSNRRHKDFQSFALPTELPHHDNLSVLFRRGGYRTGVANIAGIHKKSTILSPNLKSTQINASTSKIPAFMPGFEFDHWGFCGLHAVLTQKFDTHDLQLLPVKIVFR